MSLIVAIGPSSFGVNDQKPINRLHEFGIQIKGNPYHRKLSEVEIIDHLKDVDGLIAGLEPLNRNVLSTAFKLKAIARVGVGMDNIDYEAACEFGIKVSNTPEAPSKAVAEMTLTSMLMLCRKSYFANEALHKKEWKKVIGQSLFGATVLLIGFGRIGRELKQLLDPFKVKLLVNDPFLNKQNEFNNIPFVSLEEGLAEADIISLHASGSSVIIGQSEFNQMKNGVLLLNSARGALVDEMALFDAIHSKKVAGAWFDVFWTEPYSGKLTDYEQILLTPHIGTYTTQCRLHMEMTAVENLLCDLNILRSKGIINDL